MSLKKYLLAGGLSTVLILGACGGDGSSEDEETDEGAATEENTSEDTGDEETTEESTDEGSAEGEVSFSGETGDYTVSEFGQTIIEPTEEEIAAAEEDEEAEEPTANEVVTIEFEFTNNSDVETSAQEGFGLDLAVRQLMEEGETTLDNLTMDLPDDYEKSDLVSAATEMIEPGESTTAVVAYGPLDPELETVLQSRENPMAEEESEPLDHTIELEAGSGNTEEETEEDSEE